VVRLDDRIDHLLGLLAIGTFDVAIFDESHGGARWAQYVVCRRDRLTEENGMGIHVRFQLK
jgi:hypothetical protein